MTSVQDEVTKTGSWYNYVFHASLNTKMGSVEINYIFGLNDQPLHLLQNKVHSHRLCRLNRDQIWRLQVVGNISKSSDQLKFNRSLYFSLLLYHRSCSSLDFFGIVIVNVCFFPGADFLLNRALDSFRKSKNPIQEIKDRNPPVNGVHVRNGTFPLFANRQIHLRQRHRWTSGCSNSTGGTNL